MYNSCGLLSDIAIYEEGCSKKDKRDTQALTHIQNHILLETNLRFLDEFDKEAHSEATDKEGSDEESPMKLWKSVFVHQNLENSQEEVAESLIKLGRMFWRGFSS